MIRLKVADYKLFNYEWEYLKKEIEHFGGKIKNWIKKDEKILEVTDLELEDALRLTYVDGVLVDSKFIPTNQYLRESCNGDKKGQSTRYGPHSLHEYKGRFNPHHPHSLILRNFYKSKKVLLDPFMGSGTTLVEARGLGVVSMGVELNTFAVLIAKAKKYYEEINNIPEIKVETKKMSYFEPQVKEYLEKWFPQKQLKDLENILVKLSTLQNKERTILQIILSDLLREHSLQDPKDLRIRRRNSVPEDLNLIDSFYKSVAIHRLRHKKWIKEIGRNQISSLPMHGDSTMLRKFLREKIDGTISSPPYASALPYVDTYRLSMVALGLITSKDIVRTEKKLIGARDISSEDKALFKSRLNDLPEGITRIVEHIFSGVNNDKMSGFRKKAVPYSLTNYSFMMKKVLKELFLVEKNDAVNFWIVGSNRVKLGSEWYNIDTPKILGILAESVGFKNINLVPIQAYSRYEMHSKNSINSEYLLSFEKKW